MATEEIERPRDGEISVPLGMEHVGSAEKVYVAPQWKLMWWKFRRHRMAVLSAIVLAFLYFTVVFCEFVAPYNPEAFFTRYTLAPPTHVHFLDEGGTFRGPFVYGTKRERDPETLRPLFTEDKALIYPIGLFVRGTPYKLWGLFEADVHLFGIAG